MEFLNKRLRILNWMEYWNKTTELEWLQKAQHLACEVKEWDLYDECTYELFAYGMFGRLTVLNQELLNLREKLIHGKGWEIEHLKLLVMKKEDEMKKHIKDLNLFIKETV